MFAASASSVDAVSETPPAASNPFGGDAGGFGGGFGDGFGASFDAPAPASDESGVGVGASEEAGEVAGDVPPPSHSSLGEASDAPVEGASEGTETPTATSSMSH